MAKKHMSKKKKVIITLSSIFAFVLLATAAYFFFYREHLKQITPVPNDGLQIEIGTEPLPTLDRYFSYLGNFVEEKAAVQYISRENAEVIAPGENGTLPVGSYTVSIHCENWEKAFVSSLTVIDTTTPSLSLKEISIKYGGSFTENDFIESCTDNSGETCKFSFEVTDSDGNAVKMPSSIDSGDYTVTVTATDESGNATKVSTKLKIGEKPTPAPTAPVVDGKTPYSIAINRVLNTVTISKLNGNNEYVPFKVYVCSTGGSNTPLGNFKLGARYEWLSLYGGVYGQYTIRIHGSIAFHSVPYFTQNKADLEYAEYNKLGSVASAGCVRLCVEDVKWIYDNCVAGTPVTIYDDETTPGPLGKPTAAKIDPNSPNRGWDPTDPDPANPWKNS